MANMSNYLEGQLASHIFGSGTYTKPTTLAVALMAVPPVASDTGVTGKEIPNRFSYARQAINPSATNWLDPAVSGGQTYNLVQITFPAANGGDWGWVSGILITDNVTISGGNASVYGTLQTAKYIGSGDSLVLKPGDILLSFS